jgi:hypothetical protein
MAREMLSRKASVSPPTVSWPALPASIRYLSSMSRRGRWGEVRTVRMNGHELADRFAAADTARYDNA